MQVIGGGKMGQAIVWGLLSSALYTESDLLVVEVSDERREFIKKEFPGIQVAEVPVADEDTLLAVKPDVAVAVATSLESPRRVLSIAAGVTIAALQEVVGEGVPVIRAMPNTPALVNAGISAVSRGRSADTVDLDWAISILSAVGQVVEVAESDLDSVTGLSGSGPAYIFAVAEALTAAGEAEGLEPEIAKKLAYQTLIGSAKLLDQPDAEAASLREAVTTPNGTTAAGLKVLQVGNMEGLFRAAVRAAAERSAELGSENQSDID